MSAAGAEGQSGDGGLVFAKPEGPCLEALLNFVKHGAWIQKTCAHRTDFVTAIYLPTVVSYRECMFGYVPP